MVLHTAPQEAWAIWYKTVGKFLEIPDEFMLFLWNGHRVCRPRKLY